MISFTLIKKIAKIIYITKSIYDWWWWKHDVAILQSSILEEKIKDLFEKTLLK